MATPGLNLNHVNHVVTMVKETKRSMEFYCDFLGIKQIKSQVDNPNITWLQLPSGVMLHLIETDDAPARPENIHHAFEVEDFEAAKVAVQGKGINIENSGVRHDGQQFMFFRDPDGNRVELCTPSGF
jgi:catechol 2,3-dioxygenase-like lactoylglutathione lyase family enzyme